MFFLRYLGYVLILFMAPLLQSCKEFSNKSEHPFTNDLVKETSPYLLQHAHNPVNWRAWNDVVIEEAKESDKLIIISIGYSSCHWCHVMEEETFEDVEIAKLMNENFINIKVDREERPDIDQVYQTAAQLTGNNGGWPLNAITLPDGKPLYIGTYHTKDQWREMLTTIKKQYTEDPQRAADYANQLTAGIAETNMFVPSVEFDQLTKEALSDGVEKWKARWDLNLGGNQGQQKFPMPNMLSFLLDYAMVVDDKSALQHVKRTLNKMSEGGIYDHLGGGFFRYSTDPQWKVPHFEKMLYDNAQLIGLYSKAYKVFKEEKYRDVVFETTDFIEREMKNAEGGYFATLDADSEGEEGKFYIWTQDELKSILKDDFELFSSYFNIEDRNTWENNTFILYKNEADEPFLKKHAIAPADFFSIRQRWNEKLMSARNERVRPTTDDKIITSWNALLINGFLEAYHAFGDKNFLNGAIATYEFIREKSYSKSGLVHSYKTGSRRKEGFLEDYAFLLDASLKLYSTTLETKYLDFSNELMKQAQTQFSDATSGMFRFNKGENLISNPIKTHDAEIPSGNSVMAHNLFQLGHINYDPEYFKQSKTMLTTMLPYVTDYSDSYANWSHLLLNVSHPYFEIAVVGPEAKERCTELQQLNLPNTLIVGTSEKSELPLFEDRYFEDETYIFVCQNRVCKLPVNSVEKAVEQLKNF